MRSTFLSAVSGGRVIDGRFPLLCRLGGSEWSCAFLTEFDDGSGNNAAIKIFPAESVDEEATIAKWDVARTLSHPHLMPLFHAAHLNVDGVDLFYAVTEYADETLSQILPERPLTPEEARAMLGPILDALSYLHNLGFTHGHLRPPNIMVIDNHLKLSPDFGWRSRRRSIYDPPEADTGNLTPTADIWSLGILLVEALTQQPPAWDRSQGGEPEVPATIPEPYLTIARECLQVDPARRCTLAGIKAHLSSLAAIRARRRSLADNKAPLNPPQIAEPAVLPAEPTVDLTAKPSYKSHAMILTGAVLVLVLMIATFKFGYDLTPPSPAPAPQPPVPAPVAAQPQPTVPEPPVAPASIAATAPAPSAAPTAEPAPTPSPASAPPKGGGVKGSVERQALPDIPGKILGTIQGHVNVGIRVEVDAEGNVSQAAIDSPGPSRYFANQALHAAQSWKFTPAQVDGRAAASTWLLQFQFGQSQIAVTPSEEAP